MKILGWIIIVLLILGTLGIFLNMLLIPGGNILMLSLLLLSLIFLLQFILSFFLIRGNRSLSVMGAFMSYVLQMGMVAIVFRYLYWEGWTFMVQAALVFFIPISMLFFILYPRYKVQENRNYIRRNIIVPWIFILFFGSIGLMLPKKTFYNIFNSKRNKMTYQEFLQHGKEQHQDPGNVIRPEH
jgi:hypothetical protein